ncbi:helix-hairpin-helix domain-containing protein [Verrucosispora sp. SN26_14.1]|uniref:ComEA family DNA-binding protein n=1 Tax=Verrucosispora sp. SN26_14.1 TaxID=2527879 RepID=UPI001375E753|nr:helix-hairpin-helix domain-containing protein [Verrucosispora sp. SN26_14.1]
MSTAPDPAWTQQGVPAARAANPAASWKWRVLHSWWLLLPIVGMSCLGGFGFLFVGLKARRAAWWVSGIAYLVLGWTAFILVGELGETVTDWAVGGVLAIWMTSIVHALVINPSWLRWRAGYRPWYAEPGGPYPPVALAPPPGAPGTSYPPQTGWTPPPRQAFPPTTAYPPVTGAQPPAYPPAPLSSDFPPPLPDYPSALSEYPPPLPSQQSGATTVDHGGAPGSLDVNSARWEEFAVLPGFDPGRARQVVDARDRRGGFGGLAEFTAAANLAPHEYARLRDRLTCTPPGGHRPGYPPSGRVLDV